MGHELEAGLDRLADVLHVGETLEVAADKRATQRRVAEVRKKFNKDGFFTRHTTAEMDAAAERDRRRYGD